jgi:hypothetical protein
LPGARTSVEARPRIGALIGLAEATGRNLAAEQERWLPWCVVAFGAGIASYFALQDEPLLVFAGVAGLAAAFCALHEF